MTKAKGITDSKSQEATPPGPAAPVFEIKSHLFDVKGACAHLHFSRGTLYREIADGRLKPVKIRGRTMITGAEIVRYIASLTSAA
jgi:hypothetical protein